MDSKNITTLEPLPLEQFERLPEEDASFRASVSRCRICSKSREGSRMDEGSDLGLEEIHSAGPLTLEEFFALPEPEVRRLELLRGTLLETPRGGALHSCAQGELLFTLGTHLRESSEGIVLGSVGFVLDTAPPTLLIPDLAFISADRVEEHGISDDICRFPPDLAAEVLMPSDRYTTILDKVLAYLAAGTRIVWVVDPQTKSVTVYRPGRDARVLTVGDALEPREVLSGFRMEISEVFSK